MPTDLDQQTAGGQVLIIEPVAEQHRAAKNDMQQVFWLKICRYLTFFKGFLHISSTSSEVPSVAGSILPLDATLNKPVSSLTEV